MATQDRAEDAMRSYLTSVKEDVMTGVSHMIPFVTIGGLFLAAGYAVATLSGYTETVFEATGTPGWYLTQIGDIGLTMMVPILGAYIAYAIADRPGLAPGFVLSYLIQQGPVLKAAGGALGIAGADTGAGAGYLGALVVGLVTGYVARWLKNRDVPGFVQPMMPVLVIPVVTTAVLAPVVLFVLGVPVALANAALTQWLQTMQGAQALFVGALLGGMMALDMGGPVNKVAYVFSVGLVSQQIYQPMAAVMVAGMIPPLGLALSNFIAPQKYEAELYENAKSAIPLGLSFITEGAIPYATADPLRVIPSAVFGSAVGGAAAMALDVTMPVPHGGIFVVLFSNRPLLFLACILLGTVVTAIAATAVKPDFEETVDSTATQSTD